MAKTTIFNPLDYEPRWLAEWEARSLFCGVASDLEADKSAKAKIDPNSTATLTKKNLTKKKKRFLLFAFAYPSGTGLHVGHVESKTALDILARFYRMQGEAVFFPVGWDAFGLPAENYAIKTGIPPVETTRQAIDTFRRQIKRLAISYDWQTEIATCHPGYYRWTQWLFVQLYQRGLAYQGTGMVNWCPSCQTVLANEQVVEGACERCDSSVIQKEMKQWFFRITKYQDELISGLDQVDWPEPTKQQQLHWIGRSEGVKIRFQLTMSWKQEEELSPARKQYLEMDAFQLRDDKYSQSSRVSSIECFTTRVNTVFGVTFLAVSPEKLVDWGLLEIVPTENRQAVDDYLTQAGKKTEEERKIGEKDKTGVDTGLRAINPVNQEEVPIYLADYVLAGYGTGAVMGVPAHDERDRLFALKHGLKIKQVIEVGDQSWSTENPATSQYGTLINSGDFNNLSSEQAMKQIPMAFPDSMEVATSYKLRDWLISRQRYWGAPIPVVYDPEGEPHLIDDDSLPWTLPTDVDFKPTGESPLVSSVEFQKRTEKYVAEHFADLIAQKGWDKSGKGWRPEYDTMDTFVDSSWYYLRYGDARNEQEFASKAKIERWLPVDFYMIGPEHIVLHLLYSRFFTKFLRDEGYLQFDEPFLKMRHQGMILGPDGKKMSKSKGNVINPDDVIEKFGADTLRLYEMFMGPIEADKPWDVRAVSGVYRFLGRLYGLVIKSMDGLSTDRGVIDRGQSPDTANQSISPETTGQVQVRKALHTMIKKVTVDIPQLKFNTAIAAMMSFVNVWEEQGVGLGDEDLSKLVRVIAPFAPFLAEELYQQLKAMSSNWAIDRQIDNNQLRPIQGGGFSVHEQAWPDWDGELLVESEIKVAVQVNGKLRGEIVVPAVVIGDKGTVIKIALEQQSIKKWVDKEIIKSIYVVGKILNFVI